MSRRSEDSPLRLRDGYVEVPQALWERTCGERDLYRRALEEIDTYLAHDPDVWRIVSVCKAGDVLCDVLGAETIRRINAGVPALLCPRCQEVGQ